MKRNKRRATAVVGWLLVLAACASAVVFWPRRRMMEGVIATGSVRANGIKLAQDVLERLPAMVRARPGLLITHVSVLLAGRITHVQLIGDEVRVRAVFLSTSDYAWTAASEGVLFGMSLGTLPDDAMEVYDPYRDGIVSLISKGVSVEVSLTAEPADWRCRVTRTYIDWWPWED